MRSRANNSARGTTFGTKVSGVTFVTSPSGVTIYNKTAEATTFSGTSVAVTSLTSTKLNASSTVTGYVLPFYSGANMRMTAGILSCAGTSLSRQDLNLAKIYWCQVTPADNRANASACVVQVIKPKSSAWASGVTHVDIYVFSSPQGAAFGSAVSLMYQAIGSVV